jgi:hypothetical protein
VLRAFDATGNAEDDDVAAAIVYAADNGVRVLNLSFGDRFYSPLMHDAIRYASARGVVVVASAGNEGSGEPHYPSSYPEVISVAMTDSLDLRNDLSNFGSQVTIAAPGVEVLSTARDSSYVVAGGTSIAAPYVSGVAALILARHPAWSPDDVRGVIELSADDLRPLGWDPYHGAGRLNARRAVEMEGPVQIAITSPAAESGIDRDTTLRVVGSAGSPFIASWQLFVGVGDLPDTGAWQPLTPPMTGSTIHAQLGLLSTAGLPDTVLTLRLVLRQTNGRSAERRVRIHLDRTAPHLVADVRNVWRLDDRAIGMTASTDDRTRLTAMIRPSGTGEPFRPISLESERSGLTRTHYLVLGQSEMPRGVAHDLYLIATNAAGDTAMIGSPVEPLSVTRRDEGFPLRGFERKPYDLPFGFTLGTPLAIGDTARRSVALNRFDDGSFGAMLIYRFDGGRFIGTDSLVEEWLPRDDGDTDADGLRELLVQSGSSTRIYEQTSPDGSILGQVLFASATAGDTTLARTLGAELADVDGDGRDELIGRTDPRVLLVVDGDTLPPHYFIAYNEGGVFRVRHRLVNPTRPGFGGSVNHYGPPTAIVADLNGDGAVEILVGDDDADFILFARNGETWQSVWSEENEGKGAPELITKGDFDGDGRLEVVMGFRSELTLQNSAGDYEPPFWTVRMRRFDGPTFAPSTLWDDRVAYVRPNDPFRTGASAGDLDGRPGDELALSIFPGMYVFRWSSAGATMVPLWWRFGSVNNEPIIGDFDGNRINELGVGNGASIPFFEIDLQSRGPDVPGALIGWATSDSTSHVEWSPVDGADEYQVYRGTVVNDSIRGIALIATTPSTSIDDAGDDLPAGRLGSNQLYAYTVVAVDREATPNEGAFAEFALVYVHALARPLRVEAPTDSALVVELSAPVREDLYRTGAFDVRSTSGAGVSLSSVTWRGVTSLVLHLSELRPGDSLTIRLTSLFRDRYDAPGDTTAVVGVRLPEQEQPGERFIATRAAFDDAGIDRTIIIQFNAPVDRASGERRENYTLRPYLTPPPEQEIDPDTNAIVEARVDPTDPTRVILTLSRSYPIGALGHNYTVTVRNVVASDGRPINGGTESVVGLTFEAPGFDELRVYPQPFSISFDGTVVFAGLPRDARVRISTQSGARVRELRESEHNGGVVWDGRDDGGRVVPSGIYLYRVVARIDGVESESEVKKIAVVD